MIGTDSDRDFIPDNLPPEALAENIETLSIDKTLRDKLSVNSLAAAPKHSRVVQANEMIEVFAKALCKNKSK